jgi:hypothetical protein
LAGLRTSVLALHPSGYPVFIPSAPDWGTLPPVPVRIDDYPVEEQPAAFDRAALEVCAADAFHPGIELTWPMRNARHWQRRGLVPI